MPIMVNVTGNSLGYEGKHIQEGGKSMINTDELRGVIAKNGKSQRDVARAIGITEKTFYLKMKKGVFGSDEIEKMVDFLRIENPGPIFFAKE